MSRGFKIVAFVVWLLLFAWGVSGVFQRLSGGRELANYGSYVPWGLWVSSYIYFIGLSAGAFLLSSMINVFQVQSLKKLGRFSLFVAAITLMMALLSIWFDLGHMGRFYEVFTRPNFSSMMAWMVWLYTAYFILILVELWVEMRIDLAKRASEGGPLAGIYRLLALGYKAPQGEELQVAEAKNVALMRKLGILGIPLAIAFHGGVGALFATLSARPYWHSSIYPILFLTGALVSGGALMLALVSATDLLPGHERRAPIMALLAKIVLGLLAFDLILEFAEFTIPMWYGVGPERDLLMEVLTGRYWYVFWVFHILLGSLIPIILLLWKPAKEWAMGTAGGLIALTFLAVRLNLVIPGQVTPQLKGLESAYVDSRLRFEYVPSLFEWSVVAFIVTLAFALFFLGKKYLPLRVPDTEAV